MIFDRNDQFSKYLVFKEDAKGCIQKFLSKMSADLPVGKIELDGTRIYAAVSEYQTKDHFLQAKPEAHKEYCDIQILLSGEENIYFCDIEKLAENPPHKPDCFFYGNDGSITSRCRMIPGVFAVFFPGEGHLPNIAVDGVSKPVKKVVIKVAKECLTF